jgi:HEAT repeat protein
MATQSALATLRLVRLPKGRSLCALDDADAGVRSWAGLVLGEIGDPKTVPVLMAVAGDAKKDAGLRCNVIGSLGRMKAAAR